MMFHCEFNIFMRHMSQNKRIQLNRIDFSVYDPHVSFEYLPLYTPAWGLCVHFITRLLRLVGRLAPINRLHHNSGVTAVTPTDLSKSVSNRCVKFWWRFLCCQVAFWIFL